MDGCAVRDEVEDDALVMAPGSAIHDLVVAWGGLPHDVLLDFDFPDVLLDVLVVVGAGAPLCRSRVPAGGLQAIAGPSLIS